MDTNTDNPLPAPAISASPPLILMIGAGARGKNFARAIKNSTDGILSAIAEPIAHKRKHVGSRYIWGSSTPRQGQEFSDWKEFRSYEQERRLRAKRGEDVPPGVDAVFICVLDEMHRDVIVGLAPLNLHIMCEKPLATTWKDCMDIWRTVMPGPMDGEVGEKKETVFSIGHVLRYSPHNMLLRKLVVGDRVIGDVMSINHTEPVGWRHFTHSYVRGNWRKESTTAPSLLTKSCHDIDLLLWLLSSSDPDSPSPSHIPTSISSTGSLQYFNQTRKPVAAGSAINCFSCSILESCKYSAKNIYIDSPNGIAAGNIGWPIHVVVPEIEDLDPSTREEAVLQKLSEDYTSSTPQVEIDRKPWFGRCVYESANDVCDDQTVTLTWTADPLPVTASRNHEQALQCRGPKTAIFHMVAHTKKVCKRYTYIYGVDGEIYADSDSIAVEDFRTGETMVHVPRSTGGGHGGGDDGLARQFVLAVDAVKNRGWAVDRAQRVFVGCGVEEMVRSHAVVFAAEEARTAKKVVDFGDWWSKEVRGMGLGGVEVG